MTPAQKIKQLIVHEAFNLIGEKLLSCETDGSNIDSLYQNSQRDDELRDAMFDAEEQIRSGTDATWLDCDTNRHYESDSVAAQALDGSWVGWTYWSGGGKHGHPEDMSWIDEAYDLDVKEKEETVIVRSFTRKK